MQRVENGLLSDVSDFRRGVVEAVALLRLYATWDASYRHFGTVCLSHIQGSSIPKRIIFLPLL